MSRADTEAERAVAALRESDTVDEAAARLGCLPRALTTLARFRLEVGYELRRLRRRSAKARAEYRAEERAKWEAAGKRFGEQMGLFPADGAEGE